MRKEDISYACKQLCIPAKLGVFTADGPWHSSILTDNANVALNLLVWQYLDMYFNCMCCQKVLEKRSLLGFGITNYRSFFEDSYLAVSN